MGKITFFILKLFGWKIDKNVPIGVKKAVIAVGPHTSNWDFVIGKMAFMNYGIKGRFLIKSDLFFFPLGFILKAMGGIPITRNKNNNFTEQAVSYFENNETMFMVFTPEGTRSYNPNWKKGFYHVAIKANVPIYVAYMDYERKIGGFHSLFEPTGNSDADILAIKNIMKQYKGKFPENGIR